MEQEKDMLDESKNEITQPQAKRVNIRLQQGEHNGQPIYSNFTSVHIGQGIVMVDFGFLDPQTINTLNQMIKAGERTPTAIDAKMSYRVAVSIDAAVHLVQQLNQILDKKADSHAKVTQQNTTNQTTETVPTIATAEGKSTGESRQSGFRFPWSKKTR